MQAALPPSIFPHAPSLGDAWGAGENRGGGWLICLNLIHPRGKLVGVSEPYIGISVFPEDRRRAWLSETCITGLSV